MSDADRIFAMVLAISAIVQYYKHPHTLAPILERLLLTDPRQRVEAIVHADSNTSADARAFAAASARFPAELLRILHSAEAGGR